MTPPGAVLWQVIVPDRYIMPAIVVTAVGVNQTTVRSGPMDADTPNFGLEFGPNEFVMQVRSVSPTASSARRRAAQHASGRRWRAAARAHARL